MKRIIINFDGTWSNSDHSAYTSNVVKLARAILPRDANGVVQISLYEEGIGNSGGWLHQRITGALGLGVDERIKTAYRFIAQNFEPGDELYVFGYSRGAFQARSLVGFICLCGVLRSTSLEMLNQAWAGYQTNKGDASAPAFTAIRAHAEYPVATKCLALWDTVGNLGVPTGLGLPAEASRFQFHDTSLHPHIDVALHALAIDEPRSGFRPTLWTASQSRPLRPGQVVEQMWFPGSHSDIGGGWRETGLSDISLLWIAARVGAVTGLAIDGEHLLRSTMPDALAPQHIVTSGPHGAEHWLPFIRTIKGKSPGAGPVRSALLGHWRTYQPPEGEAPVNEFIHESALQRWGNRIEAIRKGRHSETIYRPANLLPIIADIDVANRQLIRDQPPVTAPSSTHARSGIDETENVGTVRVTL